MSRALGAAAEDRAAQFLQSQGYLILQRNFWCREGEIDLVAEHSGVLCFVEVKMRRPSRFASPLETVGPQKQRRLIAAALRYLETLPVPHPPCRFDVVALSGLSPGAACVLVTNAFSLS